MTSTLEKTYKRMNYCTPPKVDVPIIENPELHCTTCSAAIERTEKKNPASLGPAWKHVGGVGDEHYASPKSICRYCGGETITRNSQAWHDAFDCSRCGGSYGFPLGD